MPKKIQDGYRYFVKTIHGEVEKCTLGLTEILYSDLSEQEKTLFGWWGQDAVRAAISQNPNLSDFKDYVLEAV